MRYINKKAYPVTVFTNGPTTVLPGQTFDGPAGQQDPRGLTIHQDPVAPRPAQAPAPVATVVAEIPQNEMKVEGKTPGTTSGSIQDGVDGMLKDVPGVRQMEPAFLGKKRDQWFHEIQSITFPEGYSRGQLINIAGIFGIRSGECQGSREDIAGLIRDRAKP